MGTFSERLQAWAIHELQEMKRAPVAVVVLLVIGLGFGWFVSKSYYSDLYSERIALLELQREAAASGVPIAPPSSPPTPATSVWMLFPHLSLRWGAALFLVFSLALVVAARNWAVAANLRVDVKAQYDLLQAGAQLIQKSDDERNKAVIELKDTKHRYAMATFERYSQLRLQGSGQPTQPRVTIRYASYGDDYDLVQRIKGIFSQYVRWQVTVDGSNVPSLPRAEKFKVLFDVGMTVHTYDPLIHAFNEGDVLGVTVGRYELIDRDDAEHVIVNVLPSADKGPSPS